MHDSSCCGCMQVLTEELCPVFESQAVLLSAGIESRVLRFVLSPAMQLHSSYPADHLALRLQVPSHSALFSAKCSVAQ